MLLNKSLELDFPFRRGLIQDAMPDHFGDPDGETVACQNSVAMFNFSFILRLQVSGPDTDKVLSMIIEISNLRLAAPRMSQIFIKSQRHQELMLLTYPMKRQFLQFRDQIQMLHLKL